MHDMRQKSELFFLQLDRQFFQYHLLKTQSFPPLNYQSNFVKNKLTINMRLNFFTFNSTPLIYVYPYYYPYYYPCCPDYCSYRKFIIEKYISFNLFPQSCSGYFGSFAFSYIIQLVGFFKKKKSAGILIGIVLNLQISLERIAKRWEGKIELYQNTFLYFPRNKLVLI